MRRIHRRTRIVESPEAPPGSARMLSMPMNHNDALLDQIDLLPRVRVDSLLKMTVTLGLGRRFALITLKQSTVYQPKEKAMTEEQNGGVVDHPVAANVINPVSGNRDVFSAILESVTQSIASSAK